MACETMPRHRTQSLVPRTTEVENGSWLKLPRLFKIWMDTISYQISIKSFYIYHAVHIFPTLLAGKFAQLHSRAISAITTSQGFSLSRSPRNSLIRHRKKKNRPFALAGLNWPERAPNVMGRNRVGFLGQLLLLKKLPRLGAEVFPPGATF